MKKIISSRGTGKTFQLIHEAHAGNYYMVVKDSGEAHRVFSLATLLGLDIHMPLTYEEFVDHTYCGLRIRGFLIDNADYLLQYMTNVEIKTITLES